MLLILAALAVGLAAGLRSAARGPVRRIRRSAHRSCPTGLTRCLLGGADPERRRLVDELDAARAETARYRQLVIDIENNTPPPLLGPGAPDDLKLIVGVGPVLERMLHQLGVATFRQVAYWSERDIDEIDAKLPRVSGAHPPRRLGDAGPRAASEQVRRSAAAPRRNRTMSGRRQARRHDDHGGIAPAGRGADADLGLQLAGAEDGRVRDRAAHVSHDHAAVRGARPARCRSPLRRLGPDSARVLGQGVRPRLLQHRGSGTASCCSASQQLPAGRSAILAYTMPIWSVLISLALLSEPLGWRRIAGMALGMLGMALLLGDDIRHLRRTPTAALPDPRRRDRLGARHRAAAQMAAAAAAEHAVGLDDAAGLAADRDLRAVVRAASARDALAERLVRDCSTTSSSPERWRTGRGSRSRGRCPSRVVDVVAAGPDRRRVRGHAVPRRATRARASGSRSRWSSRRWCRAVVAEAAVPAPMTPGRLGRCS